MLSLPGASSVRSTLELRGGPPLQAGGTHALRVVGCLQSSPDLCGTAEVSVTLRDSPLVARLAGGNRAVGVDDGLQLDASASADPDEPTAPLNYAWNCSPADTNSRRMWLKARVVARCAACVANAGTCAWSSSGTDAHTSCP